MDLLQAPSPSELQVGNRRDETKGKKKRRRHRHVIRSKKHDASEDGRHEDYFAPIPPMTEVVPDSTDHDDEIGDQVGDLRGGRGPLPIPPDTESVDTQDDPYVYSDDSGSLSDNYFLPQSQETTPLIADLENGQYGSAADLKGKNKRNNRNYRKLLQEQRERAVAQIRGQPQPLAGCHDKFWLFLFVAQILFTLTCSCRYGWTLIKPVPWFHQTHETNTISSDAGNINKRILHSVPSSTSNLTATTTSKNTTTTAPIFNDPKVAKQPVPKELKKLQDDDFVSPEYPRSPITTGNLPNIPATVAPAGPHSPSFFTIDCQNVISLLFISGIYACVTTYLSFGFMLIIARSLIPIMLIFTILIALGCGVLGLTVFPYSILSFLGFGLFILSTAYAFFNWDRVPFCSTNLYTAICAMRSTSGILLVGVGALWVTFIWCVIWAVAVMGIVNHKEDHEEKAFWNSDRTVELAILLVSFFWTILVIKNIVRVTVASAIGAWWFGASQLTNYWEAPVWSALRRSCTTSLGSICFGSLVIFPAQILQGLWSLCCCCVASSVQGRNEMSMQQAKKSENQMEQNVESVIGSLSQKQDDGCCGRFSTDLRYCNRWAYTYIGMYGYSFLQGGEKAIQLFQTREWIDIVKDNLIQNILVMAALVIASSGGIFSVLVEEMDGYTFTSLNAPVETAFWTGSILGFFFATVLLLGVVGSAVNTILVCFAAYPFEFDKNHPRLSRQMREVWSQQVWEPTEEVV